MFTRARGGRRAVLLLPRFLPWREDSLGAERQQQNRTNQRARGLSGRRASADLQPMVAAAGRAAT
jgi:hypothetical protein